MAIVFEQSTQFEIREVSFLTMLYRKIMTWNSMNSSRVGSDGLYE
jgi:hypothetical protein